MRDRRKLRWIERRKNKKTSWATLPYEILDITVLVLLIALAIFILRISFIYAVTQTPTNNAFHNFGESLGLGSAFDIGLILSALLGAFWIVVSLMRLSKIKESLAYLVWHLFIFAGIGLLAYGCYSAVAF